MDQITLANTRIPTATYRLQFNGGFRFRDAERIVPYLHALGISDLYAAPLFKARAGSMHGYDIVDHNRLNPELGDRDDFDSLCGTLGRHGMGQILDFVPNHMCVEGGGNERWLDLLDGLLRQQVYRLAHWRTATDEINYRRFFDINALGAIRMENPRVFEEAHRLVLRLVREGRVTGLRIDHADGLYDPTDYFRRLQRACFLETGLGSLGSAEGQEKGDQGPDSRAETILQMYDEMLTVSPQAKPFYIVGEKILMKERTAPRGLAGSRDHRLRIRQRRDRPHGGHPPRPGVRRHLRAVHPGAAQLRRNRLPEKKAGHAVLHGG